RRRVLDGAGGTARLVRLGPARGARGGCCLDAAARARRAAAGTRDPAVERQLPAVPARGLLPAVQHAASAHPSHAALGSSSRAAFPRLAVGDAGALPAGAVALDPVDVRSRADVLAGSIGALCPRDTPVSSADDKLDAYHRGKGWPRWQR